MLVAMKIAERAKVTLHDTMKAKTGLGIALSTLVDIPLIMKRALAEGLPYQTLIASLLHKYASGRLKEV